MLAGTGRPVDRRAPAQRGSLESGWAAPASGPKKEPGHGERGISGFAEGGSYTSEASWGAADCRQHTR